MDKQKRIAFYGKGGIGKSTITANLASIFGKMKLKTLYIGCDPKSDSVRKLTGRRIPTVLRMLTEKGDELTREDIVFEGINGVSCIEAGGPVAGIGCAGMGLTAMAGALENLGILEEDWDVVIYDVLGDVVCGGFSVPMKNHFADLVYIVSSAEYMSLYAANGIERCIAHYAAMGGPLLGGIVLNKCQGDLDLATLKLFNDMTGTALAGVIHDRVEIRLADMLELPLNELAVNGLAMKGQAVNGLAMNGLTVKGQAVKGQAVNGLAMNGLTIKEQAVKNETLKEQAGDDALQEFEKLAKDILANDKGQVPKPLDEDALDELRRRMLFGFSDNGLTGEES